ncbi:nickel ABC transporter, nickel/metallophore periplasmic binding protein [Paenibacillus sambharensis]|uniref:Nickel ABC transporter, nickel/metallophore periplasmic binding protein n=1 Tax=Paenibacillus sambharensis TaxID=1803190 RepID=A0A2W1LQS5_9BACL|nr:nickel ABC transporter substrate-binding protein [Paenibacillus sambharensis]PZD97195.1 nickel ABC transporter, nickel/metallophore periplasmic binding protein [Paenibacillus sambharensis]
MKKTAVFGTIICFVLLLTACTIGKANTGEGTGDINDTLTLSWPLDIGPINPHLYDPSEMFAQALVYDPLVSYGDNGKIQPALAAKWQVSEDGRNYTFTLREGVLYSDGTTLTAENVKRNIEAVIKNKDRHSWLEAISLIDKVEAIDPLRVRIALKEAYYPFLQELTLIRPLRMLGDSGFPASGSTAEGIAAPIGTGPWILTNYVQDSHAEFSRNDHYWGEKPKIKRVVIKFISDSQTRIMALEKGEIDLIFGSGQLAPVEYQTLQQQSNYQTMVSGPLSTRVLAINSTVAPTNEKEVRLALQHLVDRKTIVEHLLDGLEEEAESLFSPGFPYSDIKAGQYPYNIGTAMQLLDQAGWKAVDGKPFRMKGAETLQVTIPYRSTDAIHKALLEYLQSAWREAGIDVKLQPDEPLVYTQKVKAGKFNLTMNDTWGVPYDPHMYIRTMTGENQLGYYAQKGTADSETFTENVEKVIRATEEVERRALYESILQSIHDESMLIPISYRTNYLVANERVNGLQFTPHQYEVPLSLYEMKE